MSSLICPRDWGLFSNILPQGIGVSYFPKGLGSLLSSILPRGSGLMLSSSLHGLYLVEGAKSHDLGMSLAHLRTKPLLPFGVVALAVFGLERLEHTPHGYYSAPYSHAIV